MAYKFAYVIFFVYLCRRKGVKDEAPPWCIGLTHRKMYEYEKNSDYCIGSNDSSQYEL